jgi:hypothetical protein
VDHRQRRLELVRHVGDEVAPHPRDGLELGDVARHRHFLVGRERHELQRKAPIRIAMRR